jgi:hypothetical protein
MLITYENKHYDRKTYPKLVLNILKVMGGLHLFIPHRRHNSKKIISFDRGFYVCIDYKLPK